LNPNTTTHPGTLLGIRIAGGLAEMVSAWMQGLIGAAGCRYTPKPVLSNWSLVGVIPAQARIRQDRHHSTLHRACPDQRGLGRNLDFSNCALLNPPAQCDGLPA
jgi:hypothetical protein